MPAFTSSRMVSLLSLAGPSVQMIFVFLIFVICSFLAIYAAFLFVFCLLLPVGIISKSALSY